MKRAGRIPVPYDRSPAFQSVGGVGSRGRWTMRALDAALCAACVLLPACTQPPAVDADVGAEVAQAPVAPGPGRARIVPRVDHHQHLIGPLAALPPGTPIGARSVGDPTTAEELIRAMDDAGTERAVVLSVAYWFSDRNRNWPGDEYTNVRAENDWAAEQAARYPDRLIAFCSFSPLEDHALRELDRCARDLGVAGLKMHFATSRVDVGDPEHVERLRRIFRAANERGLAIVVHPSVGEGYGREHAEAFLEEILPAAPDVPVQVAHLWGGDRFSGSALAAYAEAVAAGQPGTENLYFDVADIMRWIPRGEEDLGRAVERIRQIGLDRILYGSDQPLTADRPSPRQYWATLRQRLPLTEMEVRAIADNVAPYLR